MNSIASPSLSIAPPTRSNEVFSFGNALQKLAHLGLVLPTAAASGIAALSLLIARRVDGALTLVTFLLVYACYRIDHLAEVDRFEGALVSARSRLAQARRQSQIAVAAAAFVAAIALSVVARGFLTGAALLVFPLSVALYGTPLLGVITAGRSPYVRLKDIPYFKSFYTAFFWGLLALFALLFLDVRSAPIAVFGFAFVSMRFFVNTVFCDLKDLHRDRAEGVRTLVLGLGVPRTMAILQIVNWSSIGLVVVFVAARELPAAALSLAVSGLYAHALIAAAGREDARVDLLCDVWMDAEFTVWLPAALLATAALSVGSVPLHVDPKTLSDVSAGASGILWLLSYGLLLRRGYLDKTYGMPLIALTVNISWEFIFGLLHPDLPPMKYANIAWFFVDIAIVAQYLRYGRREFTDQIPKSWFLPSFFAVLAMSFVTVLFVTYDLQDWQGNFTGWGAQILLSGSFIAMLIRRRSVAGQSVYIALSRAIGTMALIPFQYMLTPHLRFIQATFVLAAVLDAVYVVLLVRKCRELGINPWRRV